MENLSAYISLAQELNCKNVLQLVLYNEQNFVSKLIIRVKHLVLCKICYLKAIKMNKNLQKQERVSV